MSFTLANGSEEIITKEKIPLSEGNCSHHVGGSEPQLSLPVLHVRMSKYRK